jgi:GTP-binding protein HflX
LRSGSDALAEDKLFATLDPIVRKITLPNGTECLLSDTVGFINKLPHDLVNAFQSTLDEVCEADLILHVVDCSSDYDEVQMHVVEDVLGTLGVLETPRIEVYNKIDRPQAKQRPGGVAISALNGTGVEELKNVVADALSKMQVEIDIVVPYDKYDAMRLIRQTGTILREAHETDGTHLSVRLHENELWRVKKALS